MWTGVASRLLRAEREACATRALACSNSATELGHIKRLCNSQRVIQSSRSYKDSTCYLQTSPSFTIPFLPGSQQAREHRSIMCTQTQITAPCGHVINMIFDACPAAKMCNRRCDFPQVLPRTTQQARCGICFPPMKDWSARQYTRYGY